MATPIPVPLGLTKWGTLNVTIRGVTPLLMHNPSQMRRGEALGRKEIPTPEAEAETSLYRTAGGDLYIKADHVRESIKSASIGTRIGRKAAKPILAAALTEHPEHPFFILHRDGQPIRSWEIDTRRAVVQRNGILRSRAVIPCPWEAECVFQFDRAVIAPEIIVTLLGQAGQTAGLLDYRPAKGGSFGRFEVVEASAEE